MSLAKFIESLDWLVPWLLMGYGLLMMVVSHIASVSSIVLQKQRQQSPGKKSKLRNSIPSSEDSLCRLKHHDHKK